VTFRHLLIFRKSKDDGKSPFDNTKLFLYKRIPNNLFYYRKIEFYIKKVKFVVQFAFSFHFVALHFKKLFKPAQLLIALELFKHCKEPCALTGLAKNKN